MYQGIKRFKKSKNTEFNNNDDNEQSDDQTDDISKQLDEVQSVHVITENIIKLNFKIFLN